MIEKTLVERVRGIATWISEQSIFFRPDLILALCAEHEKLQEEARSNAETVATLKTESGRAAFALTIGWPLPEELSALRAEVEKLQEELDKCTEVRRPNPSWKRKEWEAHLYACACSEFTGLRPLKDLRAAFAEGDVAAAVVHELWKRNPKVEALEAQLTTVLAEHDILRKLAADLARSGSNRHRMLAENACTLIARIPDRSKGEQK